MTIDFVDLLTDKGVKPEDLEPSMKDDCIKQLLQLLADSKDPSAVIRYANIATRNKTLEDQNNWYKYYAGYTGCSLGTEENPLPEYEDTVLEVLSLRREVNTLRAEVDKLKEEAAHDRELKESNRATASRDEEDWF